jgi:hypothetical protein
MIIAQLMGGLGNQMFQYAAARALAYGRGADFALDVSGYAAQTLRTYKLGHLNVREQLATADQVAEVTRTSASGLPQTLFLLSQRLRPYYKRSVVKEYEHNYLHFDPHWSKLPPDVYLIGYWQNERYFSNIADILRSEFTPRTVLSGQSENVLRDIQSTVSIGVHVRRGDYVSDNRTHDLHGTCSVEYYEKCATRLLDIIPDAVFYVFSDDAAWAAEHLRLRSATVVVDHNGSDRDYEDLYLLSRCQHFIVSNSTFAWWGVWLSPNPGKKVFAPQRWFAIDKYDTSDFIPADWCRMAA